MPTKFIDISKRLISLFISPSRNRVITCKLFNDAVTDQLCTLRKRELHDRGDFSCHDCKWH